MPIPRQVVRVVVSFHDGTVGVMEIPSFVTNPSGEAVAWRGVTAPAVEALLAKTVWPAGVRVTGWRTMSANETPPADRTFRDAWRDERDPVVPGTPAPPTGKIVHDMAKVRDIHLARLRRERDDALAVSDGLLARAQDQNKPAEIAALRARRQALRDMPTTAAPVLAAAMTPEAVKAITLDSIVPPG